MEKVISKFHPRFLTPVQLWFEAFPNSVHLVSIQSLKTPWGEIQVETSSEFVVVIKAIHFRLTLPYKPFHAGGYLSITLSICILAN